MERILRRAAAAAFASLLLTTAVSSSAEAGIKITNFTRETIGDPTEILTFTVSGDGDCGLLPGNFITLYDLYLNTPSVPEDFFISATQPADWVVSQAPIGPSPVEVPESASLYNVFWIYTGPALPTFDLVGTFQVIYHVAVAEPPTHPFTFSAVCQDATGPDPTVVSLVPTIINTAVPEPTTLISAAFGLSMGGLWYLRRKSLAGETVSV